jgi:predicted MFS family arabinose efflux permease
VLLGPFTHLAPAVESVGATAQTAGFVLAFYGVGVVGAAPGIGRLSTRLPAALLIATGGSSIVAALGLAAASREPLVMVVAALLLGAGFAGLHTTLQAWVVDVAPDARAAAVSLFAAGLFLGSALGTAVLAPLAGAQAYGTLFAAGAVAVVPLAVAAAAGRSAYGRRPRDLTG